MYTFISIQVTFINLSFSVKLHNQNPLRIIIDQTTHPIFKNIGKNNKLSQYRYFIRVVPFKVISTSSTCIKNLPVSSNNLFYYLLRFVKLSSHSFVIQTFSVSITFLPSLKSRKTSSSQHYLGSLIILDK